MGFVEKRRNQRRTSNKNVRKVKSEKEGEEDEDVGTEKGSGIRNYYIETRREEKEVKTRGHLEQEELLR